MKNNMEKAYFLGKYEAKYSRYEAEYRMERRSFDRSKKISEIILCSLIIIDILMMGFVRFCEMRFGESCLKILIFELFVTLPAIMICLYVADKKERKLFRIKNKADHYLDKICSLDSVA